MLDTIIKDQNSINVMELLFNSDNRNDLSNFDEIFDLYGNYLFPTEKNLKEPNIISGVYDF